MDHVLGWLKDFEDPRDYTIDSQEVSSFLVEATAFGNQGGIAIPEKYTVSNGKDLPDIKNQGSLGSCTAQAGCYMYETYVRLLEDSVGRYVNFSRLFLYKVTRNLLGWSTDSGAYLRTTMQSMAMFGLPLEDFWKYDIGNFNDEPSAFLYSMAQNYQALTYYRLDRNGKDRDNVINSIKLNLVADRPCIFGFVVFSNLGNSGNVALPGPRDRQTGGHAVCCVGYDDNHVIGDCKGAFIFANSWGAQWGENGFGHLPYEYVRQRLATDWWTMHKAEWLDTESFAKEK